MMYIRVIAYRVGVYV